MASSEIKRFVESAIGQGISREDITQALKSGGWSEQEIQSALRSFVETNLTLPVPRKQASGSPREAFFHLVLFSALYIWASSLCALFFQFINLTFPLPSESPNDFFDTIRRATASLVAAFPVFLFIQQLIRKEFERDPGLRISPVRRWLTYLTLFGAVVVLLSDVIMLLMRLLEGDITTRFVLKAMFAGLIAGGVLFHYLRDLKQGESGEVFSCPFLNPGKLTILLGALIGFTVAGAIYVTGGPVKARYISQDADRVRDLRKIYWDIDRFYNKEGRLPANLEECDRNPGTFIQNKNDPITGEPYGYLVKDSQAFELSGEFQLPSPRKDSQRGNRSYYSATDDGFWTHPAGNHSFSITLPPPKNP